MLWNPMLNETKVQRLQHRQLPPPPPPGLTFSNTFVEHLMVHKTVMYHKTLWHSAMRFAGTSNRTVSQSLVPAVS